ncbi:hypothetical protein SAMN04487947_0416 [Halogeometricum rufum]|uniref:Uncharacterized protein n=1 Tax=Halogeometricum rufum TaxID=553469 RepID=A0A1I6G1K1_9EURY|nr:hypothetical protein [Halogeometricum rufum]SFR36083.1 hypothetical protein SAMN04487947_0416 [Halogeometricum rufum]
MSTEQGTSVTIEDGRLEVSNLEIEDTEIVDYIRSVDEDERAAEIRRALRIGITTMDLATTSGEQEYVERKFEEMRRDFEGEIERVEEEIEEKFGEEGHVPNVLDQHLGDDGTLRERLDDAFGEDGVFVERLDEELGEDGERISEALDPDKEGTPTNRLKSVFKDEIRSVREKIEEEFTAAETESEMRQQTRLKGDEFEETVDDLLAELVRGTSHEYEFTGDTIGELTDRKVGDFVLTLEETGQRIVIEAKSDKSYSQPEIKKELDDAIENRDADYGIIVFECEDYVPNKVGYFQEFERDRLSIALSEDEDAEEVEPGYLRIAFSWAKTRAIQQYADSDTDFDAEVVQTNISEVEDAIGRFSTIRSKTTSLVKTANEIDEQLEEIENDAKGRLADIRAELRASGRS